MHKGSVVVGLLAVLAAGFAGSRLAEAVSNLPSPDQLRVILAAPQAHVYGDGREALRAVCHCPLRIGGSDLPAHLKSAVIATEDRRFLRHRGVDIYGIGRALIANLRAGRIVEGGSTITQQLAKNALFEPDDPLRKPLEAWVAWRIERHFSKDEILAAYLNFAWFGSGGLGIESAARRLFGKRTRDLNLYESAVLAGMLKAPARYDPKRHPRAARARATRVLARMVRNGAISKSVARRALTIGSQPGSLQPIRVRAPYYIDWVLRSARPSLAGAPGKRHRVVLGLDPWKQIQAEQAVEKLVREGTGHSVRQAALVSMAHDGTVRALVGGRSYAESQFDRATQARRQAGSTFKLFAYLAALEKGWRPTSLIEDLPLTASGWPANPDGRYRGRIPMQEAFALSLNGGTARLASRIGPERIAGTARRLGIEGPLPHDIGLALGAAEVTLIDLTAAYAALENEGRRVEPLGIMGIIGPRGDVLRWRSAARGPQVISPVHARRMRSMLRLAVVAGTGREAAFSGAIVRGKTGTSSAYRDAWFIGSTGAMTTGIWTGNDDGSSMLGVTGGSLPARAWRRYSANTLISGTGRRLLAVPLPRPAPSRRFGILQRLDEWRRTL